MYFLRQLTQKMSKRLNYGSWQKAAENSLLQGAGNQPLQTYIDRRQMPVTEWVIFRPIFEVCANEMGYKVGGRHQETWWKKVSAEKKPRAMLEEILEAARE